MPNSFNILIGGEAGQGLVTVGQMLAKSLVRSGYSILVTQSYQSRIRGGHNTYAIRIGDGSPLGPTVNMDGGVDLLLALDSFTLKAESANLRANPAGLVICDEAFADSEGAGCLKVPYKSLAAVRVQNTLSFGVLCALLGLPKSLAAEVVDESFGRHPEFLDQNRKALEDGYAWGAESARSCVELLPAAGERGRLMMNGNDAIALGAVSAGVRFCSFYPMTPATSVALNLAAYAKPMGMVVEQAEDEIAAINMAIGASFAGAPSLTATSGGGFALMVEGISLTAMTETPIVVVIAQRPGPATGMPTRTEQADFEMALYAGHGEFPRAIFAPGTVEECFYLTRKAVDLAERFQGPVFVLTDQFLADSYRDVERFDVEGLDEIRVGADPSDCPTPYLRYSFTESGVSPRLLPGRSPNLVIADSDEHTEDGHLTEDDAYQVYGPSHPSIRVAMTDKRLRKGEGMLAEVVPPTYDGEGSPDVLFVCWGSTRGAVEEGVAALRAAGTNAAYLHFSQIWPLAPDGFMPYLQSAAKVVAVEGNATGQLARAIHGVSGFRIEEQILRYDGLPVSAADVTASFAALDTVGEPMTGGERW